MKKLLSLTTSLIAAVCALGSGGAALAFAETEDADEALNKQFYPDTFEISPSFENLEDYAVGNGEYLFLENNVIYEYGSANVTPHENKNITIRSLYFQNDEFYYETDEHKVYALKNIKEPDPKPEDNFVAAVKTNDVTLNGFHYYFNLATGVLKVNNLSTDEITSLDGFLNLKQYDDNTPVYAIRTTAENKQVLCTLKGTDYTDIKVNDFDLTKEIEVGNAFKTLSASFEQSDLQFVSLSDDAYITEVTLDNLTEESVTFDTVNTVKVKTVKVNVSEKSTALLLYTAGDKAHGISIISMKVKDKTTDKEEVKAYLIHPRETENITVHPLKDSKFDEGTATEGFMYSAPIETTGTSIKNSANETVRVSGKVKILKEIKQSTDSVLEKVLDGDFYLIEYEEKDADGNVTAKYTGYVRSGLIQTYVFIEDPPTETHDPEESYADLVKPVVLILIVLLLIAIAAGYLIYVGTSDKRKKKAEAAPTDTTKQNKR